ncbi:MAG: sel1 repeat family protein [Alphaproteobacteria bacterium]|nr:sel1 repeat family protein [Alphaproteobacteria bacterium]
MAAAEAPPPAAGVMAEGLTWSKIHPAVRSYLCSALKRPAWCADVVETPPETEKAPVARQQRRPSLSSRAAAAPTPAPPPKSVSDTDFRRIVDRFQRKQQEPTDFALLEKRGFEDFDGGALEVLGYAYASGVGRQVNYVRAYEYYGLALMQGRDTVKDDLAVLWQYVPEDDKKVLIRRFETAFPQGPVKRIPVGPPPPPRRTEEDDDAFDEEDEENE